MTVIGLCLGGGQIELGLAATAIGFFALWALRWFEDRLREEHRARFSIELDPSGPREAEIRRKLSNAGLSIASAASRLDGTSQHRELEFEVRRLLRSAASADTLGFITELAREAGVVKLSWQSPI